jgi:hypothetical protein
MALAGMTGEAFLLFSGISGSGIGVAVVSLPTCIVARRLGSGKPVRER